MIKLIYILLFDNMTDIMQTRSQIDAILLNMKLRYITDEKF